MTDPLLQSAFLWRLQTMAASAVRYRTVSSLDIKISTGEDYVALGTLSSTDTSTYWTSS